MLRNDGGTRKNGAQVLAEYLYEQDPEMIEEAIQTLLGQLDNEPYRSRGLLDLQLRLRRESGKTATKTKTARKSNRGGGPKKTRKKAAPAAEAAST